MLQGYGLKGPGNGLCQGEEASVKRVVDLIRTHYSRNVAIIVTCDSDFSDEKNLHYFEKKLGILFVCFGKAVVKKGGNHLSG